MDEGEADIQVYDEQGYRSTYQSANVLCGRYYTIVATNRVDSSLRVDVVDEGFGERVPLDRAEFVLYHFADPKGSTEVRDGALTLVRSSFGERDSTKIMLDSTTEKEWPFG